jgi:hypothetical protein
VSLCGAALTLLSTEFCFSSSGASKDVSLRKRGGLDGWNS